MATIRHGGAALTALIPDLGPNIHRHHSVSLVGLSQNLMIDGVNVWPGMLILVAQLIYGYLFIIYRPSGEWGSLPLEGGIETAYK